MEKMRFWKKTAVFAVALAFVLSACGAGNAGSAREESYVSTEPAPTAGYKEASDGAYAAEEAYDSSWDGEEAAMDSDEEYVTMAEESGNNGGAAAQEASGDGSTQADLKSPNRKIVYTGNVSLQTLEYDKSAQSIHDRIRQCGGFIESEDTYNEDPYWYYSDRSGSSAKRTRRNLNITARIPADQFDTFMKDLENDGQVTNTSVNARNISVSYATHDASRKALEIEKERLLDMMDKAETVEEMIRVEERLTEVERELGDEMTQLSAMDRDVDFSTVNISLQEVFEYSEEVVEVTYAERLQKAFGRAIDGFVTFWQELILFIVETFPFLIMLGIIIALLVRLHRRRRVRKMEERARLEAIRRQAAQNAGVPYEAGTSDPGAAKEPFWKKRKAGLFHRGDREARKGAPDVSTREAAERPVSGPAEGKEGKNPVTEPGSAEDRDPATEAGPVEGKSPVTEPVPAEGKSLVTEPGPVEDKGAATDPGTTDH